MLAHLVCLSAPGAALLVQPAAGIPLWAALSLGGGVAGCVAVAWLRGRARQRRRRRLAAAVAAAMRAQDGQALGRLERELESLRCEDDLGFLIGEIRSCCALEKQRRTQLEAEAWRAQGHFKNVPVAVFVLGADRNVLAANAAACRLADRREDRLLGTSWNELVHVDVAPDEADRLLAEALGTSSERQVRRALFFRGEEGPVPVLTVEHSIEEPGEPVACCLVLESVRAVDGAPEETVQEELDAMGRLAAGVAHDFNDKLTIILGRASQIQHALGADNHSDSLAEVLDAAEELRCQTKQLLAFSRRGVGRSCVSIGLNDVIQGARRHLEDSAGPAVRMDWKLGADAGLVRGSRQHIEEILHHLVRNAVEAMDGEGTLTIESLAIDGGQAALLRVRDEGPGMDADARLHAFEPCFTSKGGKTVGLGLSVVYGLITEDGGSVCITSPAAGGTCVEITFAPAGTPAQGSQPDPPQTESGTILVVEDDPRVLRLVTEILERGGWRVVAAGDGPEAIEISQRVMGGYAPDLLLTDYHMPGMDGATLYEELHQRWPGLQVMFMSGFVDDEVFRTSRLAHFEYLPKPFTTSELIKKVRTLVPSSAA